MRPDTLLMAKLSWLLLVAGGFWISLHAPIVPGLGVLAAVPGGLAWLAAMFWIGGACLMCNRAVRGACVLLGGVVLAAPFESIMVWHPYAWVCGGVLLLCALQDPGGEARIVRWFLILVHGAAAMGAIGGAGWIDTALASPWIHEDFLGALPRWMAEYLPEGALTQILQWATVLVCLAIPVCLFVPRLQRAGTGLAVLFYTLLYVALGSTDVALFAGAIAIAQISFLRWPRYVKVVWPRACGWPLFLRVALDRYDFEDRTDWPRPPDPDAELEAWFDSRRATGTKAIVSLVLYLPVFYFALLATIACIHVLLPRQPAVALNSLLVLSLWGFNTLATLRRLYKRSNDRRPPPPREPAADADVASAPVVTAQIDTPRRSDR